MPMNLRRYIRPLARVACRLREWLDLAVGLGLGTALWSLSRYRPVQVQQLVVARIGHLAIDMNPVSWLTFMRVVAV